MSRNTLKRQHTRPLLATAVFTAVCAVSLPAIADNGPAGTTFTYQGRLLEAGEPVSGTVDLDFQLFDQAEGGEVLGALDALDFKIGPDGRFTIDLDFGDVFDGGPRWLEIHVNATPLSPRQPIMAAPHAMVATTVANVPTKAVVGSYAGITGVGTLDSLDVAGSIFSSTNGIPIRGVRDSTTGTFPGVWGQTNSAASGTSGVRGYANHTAPGSNAAGVWGHSFSETGNGIGVRGTHDAGGIGVKGESESGFGGYFVGKGYFSGNLGIGMLNPSAPLHVHGSVIAGSSANQATGENSFVSGGVNLPNFASGTDSFIGGGQNNQASGPRTFIAGGRNNEASGWYSFAAGSGAKALHDGSFVWADSDFMGEVASTEPNQFTARARGGVRFFTNFQLTSGVTLEFGDSSWSSVSDRNAKENFQPVDPVDVLMRVVMMPIETWNYKSQNDSIRHMGPMAQDFHALFGLGNDELKINTVNADGVALAAIQGLYELVQEKDAQIDDLRAQNESLEARLAALEEVVNQRLTDQTKDAR